MAGDASDGEVGRSRELDFIMLASKHTSRRML